MAALDQLIKFASNLPFDKIARFLPLDRIAGSAMGAMGDLKNRERMSNVDTAWLRMDTPTNLMMIVGVMMFDGPTNAERLKRTIMHRLLRFKRFRQRVVQDASGAYWLDDEHFDIDNHIHCVNLPAPGGKRALEGLAAALTTQSLDHNKPLWTMTVVENYEDRGIKGSAMIARIHHCIADGISLIGVMHSLTDESPDAAEEGVEPEALRKARERKQARREAGGERDFLTSLYEPISDAASRALSASGNFWGKYQDLMTHPEKFADLARIAADVAAEMAELALMPNDSATSFKGKPSAVKRVAWSEPLALADIKSVCKVLGVSINDILLASCAGALREYLRENGEATEGVEVRGMVPVNLRPRGEEHTLGNRFGLVALTLPVGIENPFVRLYEVKRRMDDLKNSYQAVLSMGILGAVGLLPRQMQRQVLDLFSSKASAVMTNVPGPQQPLYMAGRQLLQQMFWVPQSGDIGMGISILSYNGQVQFGLITDKKFVAEPSRIVDRFAAEFEKLVLYLLLEGQVPEGVELPQAAAAAAQTPVPPAQAPQASALRKAGAKPGKPRKAASPPAPAAESPDAAPAPVRPPSFKKRGLLSRVRD